MICYLNKIAIFFSLETNKEKPDEIKNLQNKKKIKNFHKENISIEVKSSKEFFSIFRNILSKCKDIVLKKLAIDETKAFYFYIHILTEVYFVIKNFIDDFLLEEELVKDIHETIEGLCEFLKTCFG